MPITPRLLITEFYNSGLFCCLLMRNYFINFMDCVFPRFPNTREQFNSLDCSPCTRQNLFFQVYKRLKAIKISRPTEPRMCVFIASRRNSKDRTINRLMNIFRVFGNLIKHDLRFFFWNSTLIDRNLVTRCLVIGTSSGWTNGAFQTEQYQVIKTD